MSNEVYDPLEMFDEVETADSEDSIDYSSMSNVQPVSAVKTSSFNKPISETQVKKPTGKKMIRREIFVDAKNTKRIRVEFTPSTCDQCGFDVAVHNGYKNGFRSVPIEVRPSILNALEEHKEVAHRRADSLIIDESEVPTQWLGSHF